MTERNRLLSIFFLLLGFFFIVSCAADEPVLTGTAVIPIPSTATQLPATETLMVMETAVVPIPSTATQLPATETLMVTETAVSTNTTTPQSTATLTDTHTLLLPPPGEIYFFWDSTPFNAAGVPSNTPKHNLYRATAGDTLADWHVDTLLDKVMDWTTEAPSFPQVALSPDQTKLVLTTWLDAGGDGDVHTEEPGGVGDLTAIQVYDLSNDTLSLLTDYSALQYRGLTWFPDNLSLAYSWGKEVYHLQLNDIGAEQITSSFPQNLGEILLSPNGNHLAIWVQTGQLFILDMNTKELRLIDQYNPFLNMGWSPDSQWLAYMIAANSTLMLGNPDTLETIPLLETGLTRPRWSPVSSQIALTQNASASSSLHVWDADTLTDRKLIEWEGNGASLPTWSPDGSKIAVSFTGEDSATIYVIDVNTGEVTELIHLEDIEISESRSFSVQSWSPDGEWLLYFDARAENSGLYVINVTSGDSTLLLEIPENTVFPDHFFWLPDSQ